MKETTKTLIIKTKSKKDMKDALEIIKNIYGIKIVGYKHRDKGKIRRKKGEPCKS